MPLASDSNPTPAKKQVFIYKEGTTLEQQQAFEALWVQYFEAAKNGSYNSDSLANQLWLSFASLEEGAYPFLQLFLRQSDSLHELRRYVGWLSETIRLAHDEIRNGEKNRSYSKGESSEELIKFLQKDLNYLKVFLETNDVMALVRGHFPNEPKEELLKTISTRLRVSHSIANSSTTTPIEKAEARADISFFPIMESMVMAHQAAEAIIQELNNHNTTQIPAQWLNRLTFGLFNWLYQAVGKLCDRFNPSRVILRLLKQELLDTAVAHIKETTMKNPVTSYDELSKMLLKLDLMVGRFAFTNAYLQIQAKAVKVKYAAVKDIKTADALPSDLFDTIRAGAKDVLYGHKTDINEDKKSGEIINEEIYWRDEVTKKHLFPVLKKYSKK